MAKKANKAKRGKDKYYHLAKEQGYRARSAFKLIQLNKKYDFLAKAHTLIDLCAAPGGWLQVAAKYMPTNSAIIGVDIMPIKAIRGVITHTEDITTPNCRTLIKNDLQGRKADVVLHDGAPNVGQNWAKDAFGQSELVLHSLKLATEFLRPHGLFITKVFRSADYNSLMWVFQQLFEKVEATKPHSSRNASAEIFVVCRDYKAPSKIDPKLLDLRYVFKDVAPNEGTGKGMAGGGGTGTVDVMHKKGNKERSREGYDESLGPLLTRVVSVCDFLTTKEPLRALTDASAFAFDEQAEEAGVLDLPITTQEIKDCCADLKLLGKKEFKGLMKWRLAVRHALPALAKRRKSKKDDDEEEEEGEEGSDDDMEEDEEEEKVPEDEDEATSAALQKELSAAAADEVRLRRREEKRKAKARQLAIKKHRLGMNLRSVDMLDTDDSLFSLARLRKLAARGGMDSAAALADLADHDLEDDEEEEGEDGGQGDSEEDEEEDDVDEDGLPRAKGAPGGEHDDAEEGEEERAGRKGKQQEEEAEVAAKLAGTGKMFDTLRSNARNEQLDSLEEELDATYARLLANRERAQAEARKRAESGKMSHGIKMTRRAKLEQQALLTEAALNAKLDTEHTKYLQLLAGAKGSAITSAQISALAKSKRRAGGGSDSEEDEGDDEESEDEVEDDAGDADELGEQSEDEDDGAEAAAGGEGAGGKGSRWFARAEFQGALPASSSSSSSGLGLSLGSSEGKGKKRKHAGGEGDEGSSDEEEERAPSRVRQEQAPKHGKGKDKGAKGKREGPVDEAGNPITKDKDGDAFPDWLANIPKSDRDKRKDKLRKEREREEKRAAAAKRLTEGLDEGMGGGFKTVAGIPGAVDDEFNAIAAAAASKYRGDGSGGGGADGDEDGMDVDHEDAETDPYALAKAKRGALIAKGMGKLGAGGKGPTAAAAAGAEDSGFEVVPAGHEDGKAGGKRKRAAGGESDDDDSSDDDEDDSDSDDSGPDPRLEIYDSDEHAELLALGKALKRHSTAKALLDASYNRYAHDDSAHALPAWFAQDERSHFRPQLPISKAEIDSLKAKFRDIAARPVHKVAEARARKKMRLSSALDKAKKKAASVLEQEELGPRSKAKAIAKAYRQANQRDNKKIVTQVNRKGKKVGTTGNGGRGARTHVVDSRMKKETRAAKRKDRHSKGKNASKRRGGR